MMATTYWSVSAMESEARSISRGLRQRDPDLLHRLVLRYQHRLLRYLVHLTNRRDLAEDLFQETWLRVLERGHQYDGRSEFCTWLYAIARNLTLDYLRRKSPVSLDGLLEDDQNSLEPADAHPAAWENLAQHQEREYIAASLADIPAPYREAVVLRIQDGLSLEEISAVTAAPLGTVKSRLYRGLDLLTKKLAASQS
jgi:RNA polymerase sigma-70 factor, ECF subfamily